MTVQWGNVTSDAFKTSNGVKQGGVLSPILFTLYMDVLLSRLKSCGFGCYIGQSFVGALGYADDSFVGTDALFKFLNSEVHPTSCPQ